MRFNPAEDGERAGLLLLKNESRQYFMAVGKDGISLRRVGPKDRVEVIASKPLDTHGKPVELNVVSHGTSYDFLYRPEGDADWLTLADGVDASWVSDRAGGFTGTTIGPYAERR